DAGPDHMLCYGTGVALGGQNAASGGTGPYTYAWTPSTGLSSTTTAHPMASPASNMTYTLTVTDSKGCVGTANRDGNIRPPEMRRTLLGIQAVDQATKPDQLVRIDDPSNGQVTLVGNLGAPYIQCEALATRRGAEGGSDLLLTVQNDKLVRVDPTTGHGTTIG